MTGRLKLTDKILITEAESLNPSLTSNISIGTLIHLSSKLSDLKKRSAKHPVSLHDVRSVLSHFGHPVTYDKELLERSLEGRLLLYRRAFNTVTTISPEPLNSNKNSESAEGSIVSDFLYLLQSKDGSGLYVGLHTLINHEVPEHFIDNRLLFIEYQKPVNIEKFEIKKSGPRLVDDSRRIDYSSRTKARYAQK